MPTNPFRGRRRSEQDFAEEIAAHLQLEADELEAEGHSKSEASRRARVAFSNPTLARERFRLRGRVQWMDNIARDLRFGLRQLHRSPGFALTAILTLALGLGANTAVFSLINGLVLRPLPVPHADQLALFDAQTSNPGEAYDGFSGPMFRALEKRHDAFQDVAAYHNQNYPVRGTSGNIEVPSALVSGQFFRALQTAPALGRYLTPDDDRAGNPNGFAVVISDGFWKQWFHRAPGVIGSRLTIANTSFTVVGVMPPHFIGAQLDRRPSIYVPLSSEPVLDAPLESLSVEGLIWLIVIGRRNDGVTLEQANAALKASTDPVLTDSTTDSRFLNRMRENHFQLTAEPGSRGANGLRESFQKPLTIVFCLCATTLLLACLNLAGLLTARAAARERELATRLAIGATRRRLIQQLLLESLLLASAGTAAGLVLTPLLSQSLAALLIRGDSLAYVDTTLDLRVFLFAAAVTLIASVVIGLVPALRATSGDLNQQIKNGSHTHLGRSYNLLPRLLMGCEVALALTLVIGAGLLATSLVRLYRTDLGFTPKGIIQLELDRTREPLKEDARLRWYQEFGEALSHQPGVRDVSFVVYSPLGGLIESYLVKTPWSNGDAKMQMNYVAPEYFSTMRIPMLEGRDFRWQDAKGPEREIVLNQSAAKALFPGHNAVGQSILPCTYAAEPCRVIGVVGDTKAVSVRKAARSTGFLAITQNNRGTVSYMALVRVEGPAMAFASGARDLTRRMAPDAPPPTLTSLSGVLDNSISSERMMAMLSVFFAAAALLVTAIGLYGTLAYSTAQRTGEIGIRIALGAQRLQVVLLVVRENAWSAAGGALGGLAIAFLASRALASFLYGTSVRDPWVFVGSAAALTIVAGVASLLPAVRAARLDPVQALRNE